MQAFVRTLNVLCEVLQGEASFFFRITWQDICFKNHPAMLKLRAGSTQRQTRHMSRALSEEGLHLVLI